MGKTNRITRMGIPKQKKEQLKLQKKQVQKVSEQRKLQKKPVQKEQPKSKYVTEGMTDYLKLMK
jgi:hypothetical protein